MDVHYWCCLRPPRRSPVRFLLPRLVSSLARCVRLELDRDGCAGSRPCVTGALVTWPSSNCGHVSYRTFSVGCSREAVLFFESYEQAICPRIAVAQ
jgi:hypothetical protein